LSSFLYGYAARGPTKAENLFLPTSDQATAEDQANANRAKQFVEMVAGLVPAEVLAIQTFIYELLSEKEGSSDESAATITNVGALRGSFIVLLAIALGFYFGGTDPRTLKLGQIPRHVFRCLVILVAFSVWTWLQPVSAWQTWFDFGDDAWLVIGVLAAGAVVAFNLIVIRLLPLPSRS
jgi:hypothetical protein